MSFDKIYPLQTVSKQERAFLEDDARRINEALSHIKKQDGTKGPHKPQGLALQKKDDAAALSKFGKNIDNIKYLNPKDLKMSDISNLKTQIHDARENYLRESNLNKPNASQEIMLAGEYGAKKYRSVKEKLSSDDDKALFHLERAVGIFNDMVIDAAKTEGTYKENKGIDTYNGNYGRTSEMSVDDLALRKSLETAKLYAPYDGVWDTGIMSNPTEEEIMRTQRTSDFREKIK
jgi:hypothetical protein